MSRVILPTKLASEVKLYNQFDFTSILPSGDSITGTPTFTASVYSGTDANPGGIIVGGSTVIVGAVVSTKIQAGVLGVIYELLCSASTVGGLTLELAGYLAVVPDLP